MDRPVREASGFMGSEEGWIEASSGRWWWSPWTGRCWCKANVSGNISHFVCFALLMSRPAQESEPTGSPKWMYSIEFSSGHYLSWRLAKSIELTLVASTSCVSCWEDEFEEYSHLVLKMHGFLPLLMRLRGLGVCWCNSTLCHVLFTYCLHITVLCVQCQHPDISAIYFYDLSVETAVKTSSESEPAAGISDSKSGL